jgi:hypothetical protein
MTVLVAATGRHGAAAEMHARIGDVRDRPAIRAWAPRIAQSLQEEAPA